MRRETVIHNNQRYEITKSIGDIFSCDICELNQTDKCNPNRVCANDTHYERIDFKNKFDKLRSRR